jgi:hypothetical protein
MEVKELTRPADAFEIIMFDIESRLEDIERRLPVSANNELTLIAIHESLHSLQRRYREALGGAQTAEDELSRARFLADAYLNVASHVISATQQRPSFWARLKQALAVLRGAA